MKTTLVQIAVAAACVVALAGCGGGGSGTSPSPLARSHRHRRRRQRRHPLRRRPRRHPDATPTPSGGTTFTITSTGVSPKSLTIAAGTRVTFVNNDSRAHDMESDPHPEHTDCPEINQVGFISPGQTKLTGNLNTRRTCGFHDHDQSENRSLQGSIIIQ